MMQENYYPPKGKPIPVSDRIWLVALAEQLGVAPAAKRVGLSRLAFATAAAGFPTYLGTHRIIADARARAMGKAA